MQKLKGAGFGDIRVTAYRFFVQFEVFSSSVGAFQSKSLILYGFCDCCHFCLPADAPKGEIS